MFGEHRDIHEYIHSLEHLEEYTNRFDEIWPSHADIPVLPEVIKKLHDGAQDMLDGKIQGTEAELFGKKIMVYDFGFCTLLYDR